MSRPLASNRLRAFAAAALVAATLGLAACGDDDETTTTGATGATGIGGELGTDDQSAE